MQLLLPHLTTAQLIVRSVVIAVATIITLPCIEEPRLHCPSHETRASSPWTTSSLPQRERESRTSSQHNHSSSRCRPSHLPSRHSHNSKCQSPSHIPSNWHSSRSPRRHRRSTPYRYYQHSVELDPALSRTDSIETSRPHIWQPSHLLHHTATNY